MHRRSFSIFLAVLLIGVLTACSLSEGGSTTAASSTSTTYPVTSSDWHHGCTTTAAAQEVLAIPAGPVTITEEEAQDILDAYVAPLSTVLPSACRVRCFGAWEGVYAVFVDLFDAAFIPVTETVGDYQFHYHDSRYLLIYTSNGSFYRLPDAWQQGLLTEAQLEELYASFDTYYPSY